MLFTYILCSTIKTFIRQSSDGLNGECARGFLSNFFFFFWFRLHVPMHFVHICKVARILVTNTVTIIRPLLSVRHTHTQLSQAHRYTRSLCTTMKILYVERRMSAVCAVCTSASRKQKQQRNEEKKNATKSEPNKNNSAQIRTKKNEREREKPKLNKILCFLIYNYCIPFFVSNVVEIQLSIVQLVLVVLLCILNGLLTEQ